MGSDCVSLHQERSRTMRWRYLGFLLLITVTGVQLLGDETAETSVNQLRESKEQSLADVVLPQVKRETQNGKVGTKERTNEVGREKKESRTVGGKKKQNNRDVKKKWKRSRKDGKKKTSGKG